MRTIDFYIDAAKEKAHLKSDSQLGKSIGLSRGSICQFRTKRAWPTEDTIERLAELAGIPAEEAVLELNAWRSTGKTHEIYKRLIKRLNESLTVLAIGIAIAVSTVYPAQAAIGTDSHDYAKNIHYHAIRYTLADSKTKCDFPLKQAF